MPVQTSLTEKYRTMCSYYIYGTKHKVYLRARVLIRAKVFSLSGRILLSVSSSPNLGVCRFLSLLKRWIVQYRNFRIRVEGKKCVHNFVKMTPYSTLTLACHRAGWHAHISLIFCLQIFRIFTIKFGGFLRVYNRIPDMHQPYLVMRSCRDSILTVLPKQDNRYPQNKDLQLSELTNYKT